MKHIEDCVGDDRGLDPDCEACRKMEYDHFVVPAIDDYLCLAVPKSRRMHPFVHETPFAHFSRVEVVP